MLTPGEGRSRSFKRTRRVSSNTSSQTVSLILRKPDGSFTGNLAEIDKMLRKAWLLFFSKHNSENNEPDAKEFVEVH